MFITDNFSTNFSLDFKLIGKKWITRFLTAVTAEMYVKINGM